MRALALLLILVLFLPGCGGSNGDGPAAIATFPANPEKDIADKDNNPLSQEKFRSGMKEKGITLYTDKFDEQLYKELGPFTARPNALFIPADNVARPLFTRKNGYIKLNIGGRPELKGTGCHDISKLSLNTPSIYFEKDADQIEKTGLGDFTKIDQNISNNFPKILKDMAIAEIGAGTGYYIHNWTQLVGKKGKVYMVDLDPFAVGFMEYKFYVESKHYSDKNQIIIIRNKGDNSCLPKNKIKLIFAQALHSYINYIPDNMSLKEYEKSCACFWRSIEQAMLYELKDPAKLIIFDHYYNPQKAPEVQFTPQEAIGRILKNTHLKLEDTFNHTGRDCGWVAVFAKKHR